MPIGWSPPKTNAVAAEMQKEADTMRQFRHDYPIETAAEMLEKAAKEIERLEAEKAGK